MINQLARDTAAAEGGVYTKMIESHTALRETVQDVTRRPIPAVGKP
jgi:hypothetical protein